MYIPKPFQEKNLDTITAFMAELPFATLVASTVDGIESCHAPLYWEDDGSEYGLLTGHLAKGNPLVKMTDSQWLIIFQDVGQYISPNWYPDKVKTHKVVPTWNYRSVHCSVEPTLVTSHDEIKMMVGKLTDIHEVTQPYPWSLDDAPEEFIQALCNAVVGFKFRITDIQAQFKQSQNKDNATRQSIENGIRKT